MELIRKSTYRYYGNTEFQSNILKFGISWGALGTVTPDRAREFSNKLNECISLVSAMNGFAEYTEGEKDD